MHDDRKLAFVAQLTDRALQHVATTPAVALPTGGMSHDKMLSFVQAMAKHGLQSFDVGGTALGGPTVGQNITTTKAGGLNTAIGNALGTNNNFQAAAAPIQQGTNAAQLNQAYSGAQGALGTQAGLTSTLNNQLGQGANAQSQLENMYLQQAQGQGPNPALAQLNQTTGQNIAQQAALAAGQRGAGANAGLIASQNAQQGAATQQQAVGQAATQSAEQQLAAEQNAQNLAANQVAQGTTATQGLNSTQQNEQNILQGANTSGNNVAVGQQSNINNVNAAISTANQNASGNILSGIGNGLSSAASFIGGLFEKGGMVKAPNIVKMDKGGKVLDANARAHISADNFALPGRRYPIHDVAHARNALARVAQNGTPAERAKVKAAVHKKYPSIGKTMCAGGEMMSQGGSVGDMSVKEDRSQVERVPWERLPQKLAMGGYAGGGIAGQATSGPQSYVGQWLNSSTNTQAPQIASANLDTQVNNPFGTPSKSGGAAKSKDVPPAEFGNDITNPASDQAFNGFGVNNIADLTPQTAAQFSDPTNITAGLGGEASAAAPMIDLGLAHGGLMDDGGKVKASGSKEKAQVKGDSLKNDVIPAELSEGEIVIPRHITMSPNAPQMAAEFVAKELAKRGKNK